MNALNFPRTGYFETGVEAANKQQLLALRDLVLQYPDKNLALEAFDTINYAIHLCEELAKYDDEPDGPGSSDWDKDVKWTQECAL